MRKEVEDAAGSSVLFRSSSQHAAPTPVQAASAVPASGLAGFDPRAVGPASTAAQPADRTLSADPAGFARPPEVHGQVAYGQSRVQIVWNRIIQPDTSSVTLDNLAGADPAGYAGLEDGVDWHLGRSLAEAALSTVLGVGSELAVSNQGNVNGNTVIVLRDSAQDAANQVGQEFTRRNLNIQPALTERPGLPVRIIVNRGLVLRPYQLLFFNRGISR
ncbi:hypothetical protein BLAT2472_80342 [Burkholderia latens]